MGIRLGGVLGKIERRQWWDIRNSALKVVESKFGEC